ncbi:cell division protein FtsQ/DivIB [Paeniglutamicibacter gangotriensis]|uniref:FtsQ-type POTRA domain-containing protein n=1 Tax=Paeniglutamicibacter gangotriensis TaxID=254787 RepID=A0A5B0EKZ3_9MICC|nr:FtsQ-type POTRA domain-containing protein [Paeniglutamicibacter gangotriensis]KAA0979687.1 FtsQ-type POTRA domain-containing protein [Paeniglutamicibacter gangotriensis]
MMANASRRPGSSNVLDLPEDPALRTKKRWLIGAGVVAGLVITLVLVLTFSPILAIKSITVSGNSLVSEKKIQSALEPLHGVPLSRVGTGKVMELLSGEPGVKDAIVQSEAENVLHVQIVEHVPVAVLLEGKKRSLVGPEGQRLAVLGGKDKPKLPTIRSSKAAKDPKVFSMLTSVLSELPDKLLKSVDHASASSKDFVELKLKSGTQVIWGNDQDPALKAKVLEALLAAPKDKSSPIKVYDISSPNHPVAR